MKIKAEQNVSNKTLMIIMFVCVLLAGASLWYDIGGRISAANKSKDYTMVYGKVVDTQEHQKKDDDDREYEKYSAIVEYSVEGVTYAYETSDKFSSEPSIGEKIKLMYNNSNVTKCYLPYKDWLTGKNIPEKYSSGAFLFTGAFFLAVLLILLAVKTEGKARNYLLGTGLLLIGVAGVFVGIVTGPFGFCFLVIFGVLGGFVIYKTVTTGDEDDTGDERLLIVRHINQSEAGDTKTVVFELMSQDGLDSMYYSYNTSEISKFIVGEKYQFNRKEAYDLSNEQNIDGYITIDISYVDITEFKELGPVMKKLFSTVN